MQTRDPVGSQATPREAVAAFVAAATEPSGRSEDVFATLVEDRMLALDNPDKEKRKAKRNKRLMIGRLNAKERRRLRANDIPADKRRCATPPGRRPPAMVRRLT